MSASSILHYELQKSLNDIIDTETRRAIARLESPAPLPAQETIRKYSYSRCVHRDSSTVIKHYWRSHLVLSITTPAVSDTGKSVQVHIIRHLENNHVVRAVFQYLPDSHQVTRNCSHVAG